MDLRVENHSREYWRYRSLIVKTDQKKRCIESTPGSRQSSRADWRNMSLKIGGNQNEKVSGGSRHVGMSVDENRHEEGGRCRHGFTSRPDDGRDRGRRAAFVEGPADLSTSARRRHHPGHDWS